MGRRKGDKLRPQHCASIQKAMQGRTKSEMHIASISDSLRGRTLSEEHKQNLRKPKEPWSEERKAARRAQIAAKKAGPA